MPEFSTTILPLSIVPAKVELLPLTVIGALPKVSESVTELAPSHKATVCPVPTPDNTDELSTFCHSPEAQHRHSI